MDAQTEMGTVGALRKRKRNEAKKARHAEIERDRARDRYKGRGRRRKIIRDCQHRSRSRDGDH